MNFDYTLLNIFEIVNYSLSANPVMGSVFLNESHEYTVKQRYYKKIHQIFPFRSICTKSAPFKVRARALPFPSARGLFSRAPTIVELSAARGQQRTNIRVHSLNQYPSMATLFRTVFSVMCWCSINVV